MASFSHFSVTCDQCGVAGFHGLRYKCLRCKDYDLCQKCHDHNNIGAGTHSVGHPFQALLDGPAMSLYFAGERRSDLAADSFTCPVCGAMGHSNEDLLEHILSSHRDNREFVICPICVAVPDSHPDMTDNIGLHMIRIHTATRYVHNVLPPARNAEVIANALAINRVPQELREENMVYNDIVNIHENPNRRTHGNDTELLNNLLNSSEGRRNPIARHLENNERRTRN